MINAMFIALCVCAVFVTFTLVESVKIASLERAAARPAVEWSVENHIDCACFVPVDDREAQVTRLMMRIA